MDKELLKILLKSVLSVNIAIVRLIQLKDRITNRVNDVTFKTFKPELERSLRAFAHCIAKTIY